MKALYLSGQSTKQIASLFGTDGGTVFYWLEKLGVPRRTPSESKKQYSAWDNAFDVIDTEQRAYWLGFLYADGCVTQTASGRGRVKLVLKEADRSHIEKWLQFLNSNYLICSSSTLHAVGVSIASDNMVQDLIRHGCQPRKSLSLRWPQYIPWDYIHHFVRGYFDGDGSAFVTGKYHTPTLSFISNIEFLDSLANTIYFGTNATGNFYHHLTSGRGRYLIYRGEYKAKAVCDWMYRDATIFLERKREVVLGFHQPGNRNYPSKQLYG